MNSLVVASFVGTLLAFLFVSIGALGIVGIYTYVQHKKELKEYEKNRNSLDL